MINIENPNFAKQLNAILSRPQSLPNAMHFFDSLENIPLDQSIIDAFQNVIDRGNDLSTWHDQLEGHVKAYLFGLKKKVFEDAFCPPCDAECNAVADNVRCQKCATRAAQWQQLWDQGHEDDLKNKLTISYTRALLKSLAIHLKSQAGFLDEPPKHWVDKLIVGLGIASEAANIGIVFQMVSKWWAAIMTIWGGAFAIVTAVADSVIYYLKPLIRLVQIIARLLGIKLAEEQNGHHPQQNYVDLVSMVFFSLAATFFLGVIITSAVGITVGWAMALIGLGIVGVYDYAYQEKLAKDKYEKGHRELEEATEAYQAICHKEEEDASQKRIAFDKMIALRIRSDANYKEYIVRKNSKKLFIGLLIGLAFLLLCGSAAVFAPPALVPILFIASKIASGYLALIAISRFFNYAFGEEQSKPALDIQTDLSHSPNQPMKILRENVTQGMSLRYAEAAVKSYEKYKNSKTLSFIYKSLFTSRESTEMLSTLKDGTLTPLAREEKVIAYLNNENNKNKSLYKILNEAVVQEHATLTYESALKAINTYEKMKKAQWFKWIRGAEKDTEHSFFASKASIDLRKTLQESLLWSDEARARYVYNYLNDHKYELDLISSLEGHEENAIKGRIYLSDDGRYIVRNHEGKICEGRFLDLDSSYCGCDYRRTNLIKPGEVLDKDKLEDKQFKKSILKITTEAGHTYGDKQKNSGRALHKILTETIKQQTLKRCSK